MERKPLAGNARARWERGGETMTKQSWRDKNVLTQLYHRKGLTEKEISDKFGVARTSIQYWMDKHDIERRANGVGAEGAEYRDPEVLQELYIEKGLSTAQIAEDLGCSGTAVREWLGRNNIEIRDRIAAMSATYRKKPVPFATNHDGYETWRSGCLGKEKTVPVHRLLAVAEWGFGAVVGMHVHHKNGIRWDNRPENIELMTPTEHGSHHHPRKLSAIDQIRVAELDRNGKCTKRDLADMFEVDPKTIQKILDGLANAP